MNKDILRAALLRDEGLRLAPYRDTVGKLTIGVGRNLDDVGISEAEARMMLDADIDAAIVDLVKAFHWFEALSDNRQHVLINMRFNLGMTRLLTFVNTLAAIKDGKYIAAANAMLESKWATQVGERAVRLADLMRKG
jgi:lysozyme